MTTSPTSDPTLLQPSPFIEVIILFLTPYYLATTPDRQRSRADIIETLASYSARTRAELTNVAQIVAFSFATLDGLAESHAMAEYPAPLRLRFRCTATALSRTSQKIETALQKRLAHDIPNQTDEPEQDADLHRKLEQTHAQIAACRNRLSSPPPTSAATPRSSPFKTAFDPAQQHHQPA